MTTVLQTKQLSPREAQADAVIIGVVKGPDGPVLAPGADDVNDALGGNLAATMAALGATDRKSVV